jgi:hypothetical protein
MLAEKKALSLEEIEAQSAFELPERATPVLVVITCLICIGNIRIPIRIEDVTVAAQVCAQVNAIQVAVGGDVVNAFTCEVREVGR